MREGGREGGREEYTYRFVVIPLNLLLLLLQNLLLELKNFEASEKVSQVGLDHVHIHVHVHDGEDLPVDP